MSKKIITSFNMNKSTSRISRASVFDRIVKEIDANEIPVKYIDQILVQYHDGNIVELHGTEISHPIPLNKNANWETMENSFKRMKDVRVFIDTDKLEEDVNELVELFLGPHC